MITTTRRSMRRTLGSVLLAASLAVGLLPVFSAPVSAAVSGTNNATTVTNALVTASAAANVTVAAAAFPNIANAAAPGFGNSALASFPTNGTTFAVLSSGNAADVDNAAFSADTPFQAGPGAQNIWDRTTLRVDLTVPANRTCLAFDYQFFTEETSAGYSTTYNDGFVAELTARGTASALTTTSVPAGIAQARVFTDIATMAAVPGTAFDMTYNGKGTALRKAFAPVVAGDYSLHLSIFDHAPSNDQFPSYGDSAVFLDNLRSVTTQSTGDCVAGRTSLLTLGVNVVGGGAAPSSWVLRATAVTGAAPTDFTGGQTRSVLPDSYDLSVVSAPAGYSAGSWSCTGATATGNRVPLTADGVNATCTITMTSTGPSLTLQKTVVGGPTLASAWTLRAVNGGSTIQGPSGVSGAAVVGTYTLSETGGPTYYTPDAAGWSCTGATMPSSTQVSITSTTQAVCTIRNIYVPPTLRLTQTVDNSLGGTAQPTDWTLTATGPSTITGAGNIGPSSVTTGTYTLTVSPTTKIGYGAGAWSCTGGTLTVGGTTTVVVAEGSNVVCTHANAYTRPILGLTVNTPVNTGGGTATASQFTVAATGPTPISGAGGVASASVLPGAYPLSVPAAPSGYSYAWSCSGGALAGLTVTVSDGSFVSCTMTPTFIRPTLRLVKTVNNTAGGTRTATAWTLSATSPGLTTISGAGGTIATTANAVTYTLAETPVIAGYQAGDWACSRSDGTAASMPSATQVTLAGGEAVTCTIVNTYVKPTLALVKAVDNSTGGTRPSTDWTLTATGPTPISGAGGVVATSVTSGTYTLTQSPTSYLGYPASAWACTGGALTVGGTTTVNVSDGSTVVCTNTSSYVRPTLALTVASPTNTGGGSATSGQFTISASGATPISGPGSVTATRVLPGSYGLSVTGPSGYTFGAWSCTGGALTAGPPASVAVSDGSVVACSVTPLFIRPTLALANVVVNTGGGLATTGDWTLTATSSTVGATQLSGRGGVDATAVTATTYTLGQTARSDYLATWSCTGGTFTSPNQITLAGGDVASCTVTNTYIPQGLTLSASVANAGGGTAAATDWVLRAQSGANVLEGPSPQYSGTLPAGTYTLSVPSGPTWYTRTWGCTGGTFTAPATIVVGVGATVSCTATFTYVPPTLALDVDFSGGSGTKSQWTLSATGPTTISAAAPVSARSAAPGTYELGVTTTQSWWATGAWTCTGGSLNGSTLTVADVAGTTGTNGAVTCRNLQTLTTPGRLTLRATVAGGTASATAFTLNATNPSTTISGTRSISGTTGAGSVTNVQVASGTYALAVTGGPADYTASWACTGATMGADSVDVTQGSTVTCTATMTQVTNPGDGGGGGGGMFPGGTTLTLTVDISGGTATPAAWTLGASGPTTLSGTGAALDRATVAAGTYRLTRSAGPATYRLGAWRCTGATLTDGTTVSISDGATATCSFRAIWTNPWPFRGAFIVTSASTPTVGSTVRYWGSAWWTDNELTRTAAGSFRGYAVSTTRRALGGRWTGSATSSLVPPRTLPRIVAVAVTDRVTRKDGRVTGRIVKVLLVRRGSTFGVGRVIAVYAP